MLSDCAGWHENGGPEAGPMKITRRRKSPRFGIDKETLRDVLERKLRASSKRDALIGSLSGRPGHIRRSTTVKGLPQSQWWLKAPRSTDAASKEYPAGLYDQLRKSGPERGRFGRHISRDRSAEPRAKNKLGKNTLKLSKKALKF